MPPTEGANSHNRSGTVTANQIRKQLLPCRQRNRTASWREVALQPTEGASSLPTA